MLFCIFRDLFDSVPHFFMIFVSFFHPSWTDAAALQFLLFPLSADVRKFPKRAAWAAASEFFFLGIPSHSLDLLRNLSKLLFYFCPTRVNFSTPSSTTFPDQVEGAALPLGRSPPPFSFFGVAFSTGQSRSFRSASLTACARKKKKDALIGRMFRMLPLH